MKKGATFERNGKTYEVLQAGLEYYSKNAKACIRPKDATRSITIDKALEQGFLRDTGGHVETTSGLGAGQLPLSYDDDAPADTGASKKTGTVPPVAPSPAIRAKLDAKSVYYLPASQLRAQVYLAHGLIYPAIYDKNANKDMLDAQAQVSDGLVLWATPPPITKNEVIIALRLSDDEIADAEQHGDTIILATPLPISRVAQIAVPAVTLADIDRYLRGWIEPDVPIPVGMFCAAKQIVDKSTTVRIERDAMATPNPAPDTEMAEAIAKYDRLLGMFAFMRNAARYHSAKLGLYADYPAQYFHLARHIHTTLDIRNVPKVQVSPSLLAILKDATAVTTNAGKIAALVKSSQVYLDKKTAKPISDSIADAAQNDQGVARAFALLFEDDYKAAVSLLQKDPVSEEAVLLAALYKFSDRQSNDHRNIKQTLHDDWSNMLYVSSILGMLGAYYGYTSLDARESRLYSLDRRLADNVDAHPPIKFFLESAMERELIEAVYQHSFYHRPLDPDSTALFHGLNAEKTAYPGQLQTAYWKDDSYRVGDLWVRAYRMSPLGRCLQRIEDILEAYIDETTSLGQYLMHACFFHAEDHEVSKRQDIDALKYRISKRRVLNLLVEGKIKVSTRVLAAALDEDNSTRK